MTYDTFWWLLYISSQWWCVHWWKEEQKKKKDAFWIFVFSLLFRFKAFFFCNIPEKYHSKFLRERCARRWTAGFLFWHLCLFLNMLACVMKTTDSWWTIPSLITSLLSLRICKSCLICPKQSQEETTVLMPLKSGH